MFSNFYTKILNNHFFIISCWYKLIISLRLYLFQNFSSFWFHLFVKFLNKNSNLIKSKNKILNFKIINKFLMQLMFIESLKFILTFFFKFCLSSNSNINKYKYLLTLFQKFSYLTLTRLKIISTFNYLFILNIFYSILKSIYNSFFHFKVFKIVSLNNSHFLLIKFVNNYLYLNHIFKKFYLHFFRYNNLILLNIFKNVKFYLFCIQLDQTYEFLFKIFTKIKNYLLQTFRFFHKYVVIKLNLIYFYDLNLFKFKYWNAYNFINNLHKKKTFNSFDTLISLKNSIITINFFSFNLKKFITYLFASLQWIYSIIYIKNLKYHILKKKFQQFKIF